MTRRHRTYWVVVVCGLALAGFIPSAYAQDDYEPNDTFETAYGPLVSLEAYSAFMDPQTDEDWFYMDADVGSYVIRLSGIPEGRDYDLFLWAVEAGGDPTIIGDSQAGPEFREEIIDGTVTGAGRFWIQVKSVLGADAVDPYLLTVEFIPLTNQFPQVEVTSPNGGELWQVGSLQSITWNATDEEDGTNLTVDLELSADGGSTWDPIAQGILNTGDFSWVVPQIASVLCLVRVTARDTELDPGSDVSDGLFTLFEVSPPANASVTAGAILSLPGEVVDLPVTAERGSDVTELAFTLTTEAAGPDYLSAVLDESLAGLSLSIDNLGSRRFRFRIHGGTLPEGNGTVLRVSYKSPETLGFYPVTVTDVAAEDHLARTMPTDATDGSIMVATDVPPGLVLSLPEEILIEGGQPVTVPIEFSSTVAVRSLAFTLTLSGVTATEVIQGPRTAGATMTQDLSVPGEVQVTFTTTGAPLPEGIGTACSVVLTADAGTGTVEFTSSEATGADNNLLPVDTSGADVRTPVRLLDLTAHAGNDGIRIAWKAIEEGAHAGYRVVREPEAATALHDGLLPPGTDHYIDRSGTADTSYRYWLEAVARDGQVQRFGPVSATAPSGPWVGQPSANPFRGSVHLAARLPGEAEVVVLDARGRLVQRLRTTTGDRLFWNGRTRNGAIAPGGIYFLRVKTPGATLTRRVVKLP